MPQDSRFKEILRKIRDLTRRRDFYVFLITLLMSAFLWLMIKLSKDYTSVVNYPLEVSNPPEGFVMTSDLPFSIAVSVETGGFHLINLNMFSSNHVVNIDLTNYSYPSKDSVFKMHISGDDILKRLKSEVRIGSRVVGLNPPGLNLNFEKEDNTLLPLNVPVEYSLKESFRVYDSIQIEPDSVMVFANASYLKGIKQWKAGKLSLGEIDEDQEISVFLGSEDNNVKVVPETALLKIDVEKYTEKTIDVPLTIIADSLSVPGINLFPASVKVVYQVAMKDFKDSGPSSFIVGVKYIEGKEKLAVELIRTPDNVYVSSIEPAFVEYVIIR